MKYFNLVLTVVLIATNSHAMMGDGSREVGNSESIIPLVPNHLPAINGKQATREGTQILRLIQFVLPGYLDDALFFKLSQSCEAVHRHRNVEKQLGPRRARQEIYKLVGVLRWVKPGSFIAGATSEEPDPWGNNLPRKYVEIKEGYYMPADDVTVGNYNYLFGFPIDPNLEKKPKTGLTLKQWKHYAALLNGRMQELWPKAYPGSKIPEFKIPGQEEEDYIDYAASIPIDPPQFVPSPSDPDQLVKVTSVHSVYPGSNSNIRNDMPEHQWEDMQHLRRFVTFNEPWKEGPFPVDSVEAVHGFRNLTGNVWKILDYDSTRTGSRFPHSVGGSWICNFEEVRVASRRFPFDAPSDVGARLVAR